MIQSEARVAANVSVAPGTFRLTLSGAGAEGYDPGQFCQVKAWPWADPLLRRPFSIMDCRVLESGEAGLDILYQIVGRGTRLMSRLRPGDAVDVLGPLGVGFPLPVQTDSPDRSALIVAGGLGVAPFPLLVRRLVAAGVQTTAIVGARNKELVLCTAEFTGLGATVVAVSEAADLPERGYATDAMERRLGDERPDVVYSCGPEPMLERVVAIARAHDLVCHVSLERRMPCGFGICYGCVVQARTPGHDAPHHVRSCLDGPVIDAGRLAGLDWCVV